MDTSGRRREKTDAQAILLAKKRKDAKELNLEELPPDIAGF
jgi:hypothetical protein